MNVEKRRPAFTRRLPGDGGASFRRRWWKWTAGVTSLVLIAGAAGCATMKMPGQSHSGPLPPLSAREGEWSADLHRHVDALATNIGERNIWTAGSLALSEEYISAQLADAGYEVRFEEFPVEGETVRNLVVERKGATRPEEILVVGAHYDTVPGCPGANDNGSGVAALLVLARHFSGLETERTVRFVAFVNEEPPFFQTDNMGSRQNARRAREAGDHILGMIALETIGYYSDEPGSQHYPMGLGMFYPAEGNFIAFVTNLGSAEFLHRVIGLYREKAAFPSQGLTAPDMVPGVGLSDHWSFYQEGFPALMVTDTAPYRYPHYHEVSDTPDRLDYDRTARVVSGLADVIEDLVNED